MRRFFLRLLNTWIHRRKDSEIAREIASHLALLEDGFRRQGLPDDEARRAARLAFGGIEQTKQLHREARSFPVIDDLQRDLRYALRSLTRSPGFTAAVILILATGIGINTAMFSVLDGVVLKPLGYPEANRIAAVLTQWSDTGQIAATVTGGDEIDISRRDDVFEAFAYYHGGEVGVQLSDHAEFVGTQFVHPDFFRVFGLSPVAGRVFDRSDARQSAIVSLAFAQQTYGSAGGALKQTLFIENQNYEIVGVMPPAMTFPPKAEIWAADSLEPSNRNRSGFNYRVVAKLLPGTSREVANARLSALALQLGDAFPDTNKRKTFTVVPMRDNLVSPVRPTLYVMMGAVAFVLLIACANVANLMLARSSGRSREIAIRAALGAGRRHLIFSSLAESILLAMAAGTVGLIAARGITSALLRYGTRYVPIPRLQDIQLDWRVLLFTAITSMIVAILFGFIPVREISRIGIRDAIHQAGSRGQVGTGSLQLRNLLVVVQIALSFLLAINAGLLLRSFLELTDVPIGVQPDHVLIVYAHAPAQGSIFRQTGVENYLRAGQALDDIVDRLRQIPGVTSSGAVMGLPTGQYDASGAYAVEGKHTITGDYRLLPHAGFRLSGPGYFSAIGIPLVSGRDFNERDLYERPPVAIISEALARESFGQEDPIGHRIMWGLDLPVQWVTIVGVIGDVVHAPGAPLQSEIYMPLRQHPYAANEIQIVLRSARSPASLIPEIRERVQSVNPAIAVKFTTMEASISDSIATPRFRMTLVSAFALIALLLAAAGIYALISYTTTQRLSEFAVRLALGAETSSIIGLVLRGAAGMASIGVALGLGLALATNRIIAAMLFGVNATDFLTYAAILLGMVPVVLIAGSLPALRAARINPVKLLRTD
jgi:putative ABC transport system permease protein